LALVEKRHQHPSERACFWWLGAYFIKFVLKMMGWSISKCGIKERAAPKDSPNLVSDRGA